MSSAWVIGGGAIRECDAREEKTRLPLLALASAFPYLTEYREPQPTNAVIRRQGRLAAVTIAAVAITI
jgi:hypothetical protein